MPPRQATSLAKGSNPPTIQTLDAIGRILVNDALLSCFISSGTKNMPLRQGILLIAGGNRRYNRFPRCLDPSLGFTVHRGTFHRLTSAFLDGFCVGH